MTRHVVRFVLRRGPRKNSETEPLWGDRVRRVAGAGVESGVGAGGFVAIGPNICVSAETGARPSATEVAPVPVLCAKSSPNRIRNQDCSKFAASERNTLKSCSGIIPSNLGFLSF